MTLADAGEYDPTCDFCKIASGDASATVVCSSESGLSFFPLEPAALGHTLVIPRRHIPDIWSLSPADADALGRDVVRVASALRAALRPDGLNVIQSNGAAASQTVFHVHVHLVPRW